MTDDSIGFVIPTYNRATMIGETLDAILVQARPHDSILVVNDGSSDNTVEVIGRYGPRVALVTLENGGKSRALNHALQTLKTEWIWICDDDDILADCAVAELINAATHNGADFVFGRIDRFDDAQGRETSLGPGYWPDLGQGTVDRHLLEDFFIFQNASLVRRSLYVAAGPFDESLPRSIDYDMALRLSALSAPLFVDLCAFHQRQHNGARGPAHHRHSAADMVSVWTETDIRIFTRFLGDDRLDRFRAPYEGGFSWERDRAAHLLRATVMARHAHPAQARADWFAAATIEPDATLSRVERDILGRTLGGKFASTQSPDPQLVAAMRDLRHGNPLQKQMASAILSGGMWRLRHGDGSYRASQMAVLRESGRGVAAAAIDYTVGKILRSDRPSELRERHVAPVRLADAA